MSTENDDVEIARRIAHVKPLFTLREKADPRHTALLVIDMQNDFLAPGGVMSQRGDDLADAQKMAARLPTLVAAARSAGALVVFVRNVYGTDGNLYLSDAWMEHASRQRAGAHTRFPLCAAGSWGGEFYGEIRPQPGDPVVTKHRYDAFYNTDLDTILRANGIRTIVFTGVVTNVCVETSARAGFIRDYYVLVVRDGTAAYSPDDHDATMKNIDGFFGETASIGDLCYVWRGKND